MPPGDRRRRIVSTLVQRVLIIWTRFDKFKDEPARFFRVPRPPPAAGPRRPERGCPSGFTCPLPARKRAGWPGSAVRVARGVTSSIAGPASRRPGFPPAGLASPRRAGPRMPSPPAPPRRAPSPVRPHRSGIFQTAAHSDRSLFRLSCVKGRTGMANSRDIHSGFSHFVCGKNHPMTIPDRQFPTTSANHERLPAPRGRGCRFTVARTTPASHLQRTPI